MKYRPPSLPPPDEVTPEAAIEYLKKFIIAVGLEIGVDPDDLGVFGPVIALYVLEREMLGWAAKSGL
jgi:hypothetical protein